MCGFDTRIVFIYTLLMSILHTPLVVGIILIIIWILRTVAPKVPSKYAPFIAIALGILTAAVGNEVVGITSHSLINGALAGLASAGLWDASKALHK
jgi:hypothetical protein